MANYTMELNDIINLGYEIFNFDYPFYTEDAKIKEQFEQYFISYFYFHEIGCETFSRWQWLLRNKLMTIMPYYSQLYQTQWNQVESNMMLSKNLVETTKRELSNIDDYTSSSKDKLNSQQSQQSQSQSTHSGQSQSDTTASASSYAEATEESSNLSDGVLVADLSHENRTGMTKSSSSSSSESVSNQTSTQSDNDNQTLQGHNSLENESTNNSESQSKSNLIEEITFISQGDIGVQTPAYAIKEWRSVIININEMIMKDCESLFMQIY